MPWLRNTLTSVFLALALELGLAQVPAQSPADSTFRITPLRPVAELEKAIQTYIAATNADPKPFRWTKTADNILASIQHFCLRTLVAKL